MDYDQFISYVQKGNKDSVKATLSSSVLKICPRSLGHSLMMASFYGHAEIVEILLSDFGADINYRDNDGETALHRACRSKREDVIKVLLAYGADLSLKSRWGDCGLDEAKGETKEYCKRLMEEKAYGIKKIKWSILENYRVGESFQRVVVFTLWIYYRTKQKEYNTNLPKLPKGVFLHLLTILYERHSQFNPVFVIRG